MGELRLPGRRPDFFIVGAPKAGTSSLFAHLGRHPEIFVPDLKEPHFFGADHERLNHRRFTEAQYLALFAQADGARRVGEASTSYLHSRRAAEEIKAFSPDARIIVMLRDPVEVMHALHGEMVAGGFEHLCDFAEALEAEPRRKAGALLPRAAGGLRDNLYYREMVSYADQVERYLHVFGRSRVHIIVFDVWAADTAAAYREVLRFLDVDPGFAPDLTRVVNSSKRPRIVALQRAIFDPPAPLRRLARRALSDSARSRVRYGLASINTATAPRDPLPPALGERLARELRPDVARLESVLGRSLPGWLRGDDPTRTAVASRR